MIIVQQVALLLCKDLTTKICLFCQLKSYASFHEGSSPGETPGVYEPRPYALKGMGILASLFKKSIWAGLNSAVGRTS